MARVLIGTFVDTTTLGGLRILHDHRLELDDKGYIASFGPSSSSFQAEESGLESQRNLYIAPEGSFFIPTFCDLHLHAPQYLYQGTGLDLPLMEWLNRYAFKAEERIDNDPELARRVYKRLAERLIENGTGAVLLFGTIKEETNLILADIMQAAGIRAFIGKLSMDQCSRPSYVEESADASLAAAKSFSRKCIARFESLQAHERRIVPVLTPRFVPTCSDALLRGLGEIARLEGMMIQSHLAEARDQVDWVKEQRGVDDIEVFDRNELLTPKTIQAHCTFLPCTSLKTLKDRGTSIAHCPLSNAYFSSQPFRLREALDIGVKVGLGTDIAGGYSLDIMNAMRTAVAVSRIRQGQCVEDGTAQRSVCVDWKMSLYLATCGGATALGLRHGSGTFTIGVPFDAQLIRLFDHAMDRPFGPLDFFEDHPSVTEEAIEKWWCIGDSRNRQTIWVQGREVVCP